MNGRFWRVLGSRLTRTIAGAAAAAAALSLLVPAGSTQAATSGHHKEPPAGLPQLHPANGTPHFPASTSAVEQVRQLVQCGGTMYAVGGFSIIEQGGKTFKRNNAVSFSATAPFTITSWNPNANGVVNSITFNAGDCAHAYLGGRFTKVGGMGAVNIAEVRTSGAGPLVAGFRHSASNAVETLASYQNHILAGGYFTTINGSSSAPFMASLNPRTGSNDGFVKLHISGHFTFPGVSPNGTRVYNQQVSHNGRLDLVEGDFTSAGGKRRQQIFMLNLASGPTATLTSWTSPRFDGSRGYPPKGFLYNCWRTEPFYMRAAAWSPDDRTVYIATTGLKPWNSGGGFPLRGLCDAATAFSATGSPPAIKWTNYTGCDSLYAVAALAGAAFFAGHERWSQNPNGCNRPGPGAIASSGVEALNPATGHLLLNSQHRAIYTRDRGLGADDMLTTSAGLWIASDNFRGAQMCDSVRNLAGICFLPF
jgi:hypothetical protein